MNTPQSNFTPLDTPKYPNLLGVSSVLSNSMGDTPVFQMANTPTTQAPRCLRPVTQKEKEEISKSKSAFLRTAEDVNNFVGLNVPSQLSSLSSSKIPLAPGSVRLNSGNSSLNINPLLDIAPKTFGPTSNLTPSPCTRAVPSVGDIPVPVLQNIVCTVNLGCQLSLKDVALKSRNAEYNPKRFAAVIMRIREPKTTALIFSSGKMVCTGSKSEDDAIKASRKYARIIQKLGFDVRFKDFKIQNMVGSCDVKFSIRLEGLTLVHDGYSTYEPELFPGLIYRMHNPKIVLLIFVSGKVVLTGAKVREQIYEGFNKIYPILKSFQKTSA